MGDSGLRDKKFVGSFNVLRHFFVEDDGDLLGCEFVDGRAFGIAIAAEVESHHVKASGGHAGREVVPDLALAVALMEENYPGAGMGSGEKGPFELEAIRSGEIDNARQGRILRRGRESTEQHGKNAKELHGDLQEGLISLDWGKGQG